MVKNIITSAVLVVFLTLGVGVDASAQTSNEFCWKDSYGRGVGTVPKACKSNQDRIGLLCYNKCPRGQKRFGFDCHSVCPSGMRDDGLFCRKAEYGRGAGYPWKFGDALNDRGMFKRCERKHGKRKCEKWGAVVYPKCKKGYKPFGCCICRPSVPNCKKLGLKPGIDLSCAKVVNVVGPQTGICGRGQQKDAGLCYKNCRSGYTGVGPVCWNKSPKGFVDCGMGAAKNSKICASVTSNQVISVGFLALNVATMGGSSAAQKSTKASKFAALKKKWEAFEKTKTYKRAAEAAKRAGQANNFYKAGKNIKTASTPEDKARAAANLAAVLDPTGVADVVGAFTYPKCSTMVSANPSMFTDKPAKTAPKSPKPANLAPRGAGNQVKWQKLPGKLRDIGVGANGVVWGVNKSQQIYRWTGKNWQKMPGAAVRVDVGPRGNAWVVNRSDDIFRWTGNKWQKIPGKLKDIGVGANGVVWGVNKSQQIYRWKGKNWQKMPGAAVRVDVDPRGNAWVINRSDDIFRWTGNKWQRIPGKLKDIGVGPRGKVWGVNKNQNIYRRDGNRWTKVNGRLTSISVGPGGIPYGTNSNDDIFRGGSKPPRLTNLKFPTFGARSSATPQCIQAEKTLRSKRMLNRAGTLIKNDCAVMYRKKWLKGKGKNNPRVCRPAWNALFKSKALGATKILVTKKCPIIYANRWRKQTNFHMPGTGGSIAGKVARLKVQHSNQCVDVSGGSKNKGQRLIQWSCHKGANQRFKLEPRGKGFYRIRAQHSNQCLDIRGGSKKRGADLIQWSCHNGPNQQWKLEAAGGGWYRIKARHSNQCLDVSGGSKKRGQKLIQWPCHKGANQKFRLN